MPQRPALGAAPGRSETSTCGHAAVPTTPASAVPLLLVQPWALVPQWSSWAEWPVEQVPLQAGTAGQVPGQAGVSRLDRSQACDCRRPSACDRPTAPWAGRHHDSGVVRPPGRRAVGCGRKAPSAAPPQGGPIVVPMADAPPLAVPPASPPGPLAQAGAETPATPEEAPRRLSPAHTLGRYRSTPTPLSYAVQRRNHFVTKRSGEKRLLRNPVSLAAVRGSAHRWYSLVPRGLPFSDGAFVARTAPSGTTPDTCQPAPRLHHLRT